MCNERGRDGASATHTPTHTYTFAQKFAQLEFVCNTVCKKDGNDTQTYNKFDTPQTMRNTVCKRNFNLKLNKQTIS